MRSFLIPVLFLTVFYQNSAFEGTGNVTIENSNFSEHTSSGMEELAVGNDTVYNSLPANETMKTARTLFHLIAHGKLKLATAFLLKLLFWKTYNVPHGPHVAVKPPVSTSTKMPEVQTTTTTPSPTNPVYCDYDNDLIIGVDSSYSVTSPGYKTALEFRVKLTGAWKAHTGNRLEVIIFSHELKTLFNLDQSTKMSMAEIQNVILRTPYHAGGTKMHLAIEEATRDFLRFNRSSPTGYGVPNNLFIISDGKSDLSLTKKAATKFHTIPRAHGFAVGVGNSVSIPELEAVTNDEKGHVFRIQDFDNLLAVLRQASVAICTNSYSTSGFP